MEGMEEASGWWTQGLQGHGGDGQLLSSPILPPRGASKDKSSLHEVRKRNQKLAALVSLP